MPQGQITTQDDSEEIVQSETTPLISSQNTATPLPWKALIIVQLLAASQPLALDIIFPFISQMILEVGIVKEPEEVGFYSGIIMAIYPTMGFVASWSCNRLMFQQTDTLIQ